MFKDGFFISVIICIKKSKIIKIKKIGQYKIAESEFRTAVNQNNSHLLGELKKEYLPLLTILDLPDYNKKNVIDFIRHAFPEIYAELPKKMDSIEIIPLFGKVILPGMIDTHVHFRTPGQEHKEDFTSASKAALKGGVTTAFDMPNNKPAIIDKITLKQKKKLAQSSLGINYGFYLGVTDTNIDKIFPIKNVAGYKIYLGSSTGDLLVTNWQEVLPKLLQSDKPVVIHAEDELVIRENLKKVDGPAVINHGKVRDRNATLQAMKNIQNIFEQANNGIKSNVIIAHISTAEEIDFINEWKQMGYPVFAELTLHHLFLNEEDFIKNPNFLKINPPLRTEKDNSYLLKSIQNNGIDCIGSDHAPHTKIEKESDDPPSGVPGMEYNLLLLFDLFISGTLSMDPLLKVTSENALRIFSINNKGKISENNDADLVILDPWTKTSIIDDAVISKAGFTPFNGRTVQGSILLTMVNGRIGYFEKQFYKTEGKDLFN